MTVSSLPWRRRVRITWTDETGEREHHTWTRRIGLSLLTFAYDTARSLATGKHHGVKVFEAKGVAGVRTREPAPKKPKINYGYAIRRDPVGGFGIYRSPGNEFLGTYADRYAAAAVIDLERIKDEVR